MSVQLPLRIAFSACYIFLHVPVSFLVLSGPVFLSIHYNPMECGILFGFRWLLSYTDFIVLSSCASFYFYACFTYLYFPFIFRRFRSPNWGIDSPLGEGRRMGTPPGGRLTPQKPGERLGEPKSGER